MALVNIHSLAKSPLSKEPNSLDTIKAHYNKGIKYLQTHAEFPEFPYFNKSHAMFVGDFARYREHEHTRLNNWYKSLPEYSGLMILFNFDELLWIGDAVNIRKSLKRHIEAFNYRKRYSNNQEYVMYRYPGTLTSSLALLTATHAMWVENKHEKVDALKNSRDMYISHYCPKYLPSSASATRVAGKKCPNKAKMVDYHQQIEREFSIAR